ncbi:MAG: hypothetical protein MJE68_17535 [Proteobacteria bacterium]|nr:hypothetical protein [Pseudomonadota bacterium]
MKNTFADNMAFLKVDKPPEPYKHSGQFLKQDIAEDILSVDKLTVSADLQLDSKRVCLPRETRWNSRQQWDSRDRGLMTDDPGSSLFFETLWMCC